MLEPQVIVDARGRYTEYVDGSFLPLFPSALSHSITQYTDSSDCWIVHTKAAFYALCYFGHNT